MDRFEKRAFRFEKDEETQKTKRPFIKKTIVSENVRRLLTTVNVHPSLKIVNELYKTKFLV